MRVSIFVAIIALAGAAIYVLAGRDAGLEDGFDLVLDDVAVLDTRDGALSPGRAIAIRDGAIVRIAAAGSLQGAERVDGAGRIAIPGLWDSHVHAFGATEETLQRNMPLFLAHGVTQIRDVGSNDQQLVALREALAAEGAPAAPLIIASGPMLLPAELRWYQGIQIAVPDAEAAAPAIDQLEAIGADFLKAYSGLSEESYLAIMAEAQSRGMPVDGHVPDAVGLNGVVAAGQRTIEHLDLSALLSCVDDPEGRFDDHLGVKFGQGMAAHYALLEDFYGRLDWSICGAAFDALSARGGAFVPTLIMEIWDRGRTDPAVFDYMNEGSRGWCETNLSQIDAVPEADRERAYAAVQGVARSLHERGVTLLAGTDNPNYCLVPGVTLSWEIEALNAAGLTPLESLQAATLEPARVFGVGHAGYLAEGGPADIVLLDANPLDELTTLRSPSGVMRAGEWFDAEALEAMKAQAAAWRSPVD
jgi:imidazolonepropionase-like amidohydrolase